MSGALGAPESIRVMVTGLREDGTALARDQLGRERTVRYDVRPKGTGVPAEGEIWVACRSGSSWYLDRLVRHPDAPVVSGSRSDPDGALAALLEALATSGLIVDETTA